MVEYDTKKQEYLKTRFPHARCVFNDMKDMGNREAATWDGSVHKIPKVGFVVKTTVQKLLVLLGVIFGFFERFDKLYPEKF